MSDTTKQIEQLGYFKRGHLIHWGEDDGQQQARAWDRLRRVCLELGLRIPTRDEVRAADQDLEKMRSVMAGRDEQEWTKDLFAEEWAGLVICSRADDGEAVLCHFGAGYILQAKAPTSAPATNALTGEKVPR
ncbi:MAG: hypothetical protein KGJ32_02020 [Xanthomonadaceae bacterium]|nr:hypothetical protein [Xanthomonadaceae bacterium]